MKLKNNTSSDIVVINGNEELLCNAGSFLTFECADDELYIKNAEKTPLVRHIKMLRYKGKNSIRGMVNYFHPGFYFNYTMHVIPNKFMKELTVERHCFSLHDIVVFSTLSVKEKVKTELCFENKTVQRLLSLFITLFAVPVSLFLTLITFVAVSGIFTDFDWSFVFVTALCLIFSVAFIGIMKNFHRLLRPDKYVETLSQKAKTIIIKSISPHFLSYF